MMIDDRGMKKWHGFMMPEHISDIKEMWLDGEREKKPILDEFQLKEIDEKLTAAQEFSLLLVFDLWFDGFFEEVEGIVHKVDILNKVVWINSISGELAKFSMDNVIGVEFKD